MKLQNKMGDTEHNPADQTNESHKITLHLTDRCPIRNALPFSFSFSFSSVCDGINLSCKHALMFVRSGQRFIVNKPGRSLSTADFQSHSVCHAAMEHVSCHSMLKSGSNV